MIDMVDFAKRALKPPKKKCFYVDIMKIKPEDIEKIIDRLNKDFYRREKE